MCYYVIVSNVQHVFNSFRFNPTMEFQHELLRSSRVSTLEVGQHGGDVPSDLRDFSLTNSRCVSVHIYFIQPL